MAFQKFTKESAYVTIDFLYEDQRLLMHTGEIPLLHADYDTNTFIIDRTKLDDDEFYMIREDLLGIDQMPVPLGSSAFQYMRAKATFFRGQTLTITAQEKFVLV